MTRTTTPLIILAGATGALGQRIARELRRRGADVRAIVRSGTAAERLAPLSTLGVTVAEAISTVSTSWRQPARALPASSRR